MRAQGNYVQSMILTSFQYIELFLKSLHHYKYVCNAVMICMHGTVSIILHIIVRVSWIQKTYNINTKCYIYYAELCSPDRDIYFLIDTTSSNNRKQFCQLEYGVEQVIAALDPGSDMSGTRIGAIFYPRRIRVSGRYELSSSVFFKLGSSCSEVMPKYHAMIDSFYHRPDPYIDGKTNPYDEYVQIIGTFPAVAIRKVTDQIQQSIDSGESSTRRRLIVVITDGNNQGTSEELIRDVTALTKVSTGVTIVAVGNSRYFIDRSNQEKQEFNASLNLIADGNSSNVLISEDSTEVAIQLVQKMVQLGVLCENQGERYNIITFNNFIQVNA